MNYETHVCVANHDVCGAKRISSVHQLMNNLFPQKMYRGNV